MHINNVVFDDHALYMCVYVFLDVSHRIIKYITSLSLFYYTHIYNIEIVCLQWHINIISLYVHQYI